MGTSVTSFRDGNSPRHKTISDPVYPSMKLRLRTAGLLAADLWCHLSEKRHTLLPTFRNSCWFCSIHLSRTSKSHGHQPNLWFQYRFSIWRSWA